MLRPSTLSVPTPLEDEGNFSQSLYKNGTQQVIYNPSSTTANGTRTPFPGNIIPAGMLNPIGAALASYYPAPNEPTPYYGAPTYVFTGSFPNHGDQRTVKADQQFTPWLRASGSFIYQKRSKPIILPTFSRTPELRTRPFAATARWTRRKPMRPSRRMRRRSLPSAGVSIGSTAGAHKKARGSIWLLSVCPRRWSTRRRIRPFPPSR